MSHHKVKPALRKNARTMRKAMTEAELKFWNVVRAHRLMGLHFRRQMPIAGYIVDFACPEHKIIVEIDGSGHGRTETLIADAQRSERLAVLGWAVLRFWNDDVLKDIDGVCTHILRAIGFDAFEEKSPQELRIVP
jgi:very-short-patch-repair endonuclease